MKFSVKSDYATRAVLWLARKYPEGKTHRIEELAQDQEIPANYLVQILISLKSGGLVKSQRGKEGGYRLAKDPEQITLGAVLRSVYGQTLTSPAVEDPNCPPELKWAWSTTLERVDEAFDSINFKQILERGAGLDRMYYI